MRDFHFFGIRNPYVIFESGRWGSDFQVCNFGVEIVKYFLKKNWRISMYECCVVMLTIFYILQSFFFFKFSCLQLQKWRLPFKIYFKSLFLDFWRWKEKYRKDSLGIFLMIIIAIWKIRETNFCKEQISRFLEFRPQFLTYFFWNVADKIIKIDESVFYKNLLFTYTVKNLNRKV